MRRRLAWIGAAALLAGCASSSTEVLTALQPGGGAAVVFRKPAEIVFPAAVRVINLSGQTIREARLETGRIVVDGWFSNPAVFFQRLPNGRTRVELTSSSGEEFFTSLREQIVVYEKIEAAEREKRREAAEQELSQTSPGTQR